MQIIDRITKERMLFFYNGSVLDISLEKMEGLSYYVDSKKTIKFYNNSKEPVYDVSYFDCYFAIVNQILEEIDIYTFETVSDGYDKELEKGKNLKTKINFTRKYSIGLPFKDEETTVTHLLLDKIPKETKENNQRDHNSHLPPI